MGFIYLCSAAAMLLTTKSDLEDSLSWCPPGPRLTTGTGGLMVRLGPAIVSSISAVACTHHQRKHADMIMSGFLAQNCIQDSLSHPKYNSDSINHTHTLRSI